jgi:succinate dehydrogenase/fumarate reductase-like Fe-S protein
MADKSTQLTVYRFDPSTDKEPRFQTYSVPAIDGLTVMDALDYVYEHLDGSLAYYDHAACKQSICARCTLLVNGKPILACNAVVSGDTKVEPLPRTRVVRDLVYERGGK